MDCSINQDCFKYLSKFIKEDCNSCTKNCKIPSIDVFVCIFNKLAEKNKEKIILSEVEKVEK